MNEDQEYVPGQVDAQAEFIPVGRCEDLVREFVQSRGSWSGSWEELAAALPKPYRPSTLQRAVDSLCEQSFLASVRLQKTRRRPRGVAVVAIPPAAQRMVFEAWRSAREVAHEAKRRGVVRRT